MRTPEDKIDKKSQYYIYSPGRTARELFLYPVCAGISYYEEGYMLQRNRFDSFLILYVISGTLNVQAEGIDGTVREGQFLILDCYYPHCYGTKGGCTALWVHFDGITARGYAELAVQRCRNICALSNPAPAVEYLRAILRMLSACVTVQEALLSRFLTDLMTEFLISPLSGKKDQGYTVAIQEVISYITAHLEENLNVETLCRKTAFSPYHFIRIFKRETGFTPHQYVMNVRMDTARYLLANTNMQIKEICSRVGFSSESTFSTAFRKAQGISPAHYRNRIL